jgi:hypothetical protein
MSTGPELAADIRAAMAEFQQACAGVDETSAGRAPKGRWTPFEIASHVAGPEGPGLIGLFDRFLSEDAPRIDLVPEQTYMTDARRAMNFAAVAELAAGRYEAVAAYAEKLTPAQLARTAHVPVFKDSPMGERPSLATMIGVLGANHVRMHAEHLREVLAGKPA